jgi:serine/threonine-protein kinase HipA
VLLQGQPVADLRRTTTGGVELAYRESVADASAGEYVLSISLPVQKDPYPDRAARPFLDGLLPEGRLREQLCQQFRLDLSDVFGLLSEIGRDCAGAISFVPPNESSSSSGDSVRWLSEKEFGQLLDELPSRPLGADPAHGVRMSLAGAQNKIPMVVDAAGRLGLPSGLTPSTHILKPASSERTLRGRPRFPGLVENEAFCLRLAGNCGFSSPSVKVRTVAQIPVLLIERYDRVRAENSATLRVHQEDVCQALGKLPSQKYEEHGGPGVVDVVNLLRRVSADAGRDVLDFLDRTAFNFAIGNLDAHGKNVSLLYRGGIRLAPMYDLVSTAVFPHLETHLAMSIGGQFQADQVNPRHWVALLEAANLNTVGAQRRLARVGERLMAALGPTREQARSEGFDHEKLNEVERCVKTGATKLLALQKYEPRRSESRGRASAKPTRPS